MRDPDGIEICCAQNPAPARRWDYCSLAPGHAGEHRAHENYDTGRAYDSWPNTLPPVASPTPIDPARLTLAAAALQGLLTAGKWDAWASEDIGFAAAESADATLAALRKGEA